MCATYQTLIGLFEISGIGKKVKQTLSHTEHHDVMVYIMCIATHCILYEISTEKIGEETIKL
jgi:ABC-type phosphate/phosphonate transport system permease subunit